MQKGAFRCHLASSPGLQAPEPQNKNKAALLLAPIILISQVVLFLFVFNGDGCQGSVEGQMRSTGKPHGDFTMKPEACFSGEHESFFGVWVAPKLVKVDGRQGFIGGLKILKSDVGKWKVFVESPNDCEGLKCEIRPLPEEHCPTFDVGVRNTSTTINDIRVREGHAKLDCTLPEGGTFQADLKFDGCS